MIAIATAVRGLGQRSPVWTTVWLLLALLGLAAILLAFVKLILAWQAVGPGQRGEVLVERNAYLRVRHDELLLDNTRLLEEVRAAEATIASLRAVVHDLRAELVEYREELGLYRSLATGAEPGLAVQRLVLEPIAEQPQTYRYRLVLARFSEVDQMTTGQIRVQIHDHGGKRLDLRNLGEPLDQLPLRLRYLQRLSGVWTLPEGFIPAQVIVEVQPDHGESFRQAFSWGQLIANGNP